MENIKKQIVKDFILCTLALSVSESILDSLFDDCIFQVIKNSKIYILMLTVYIALSVILFAFFAVCFYKIVSKKLKKENERQMREKNLIFANIAHDMKTPLTSILGFSRALAFHEAEPDRQDEFLNIIYEKAKKTDELMNIMFQYSKIGTEAYKLNFANQDICSVIRSLIAESYSEFELRSMILEINIPEEQYFCWLDKTEFSRAFNNILINAYKHNVNGSLIMAEVKKCGRRVLVTVADNGTTLSSGMCDTIFEPFISGNESRNSSGGNGLGLAISKRIVEKHGGRLYVNNNISGYVKGFVIELEIIN